MPISTTRGHPPNNSDDRRCYIVGTPKGTESGRSLYIPTFSSIAFLENAVRTSRNGGEVTGVYLYTVGSSHRPRQDQRRKSSKSGENPFGSETLDADHRVGNPLGVHHLRYALWTFLVER